MTRHANLTKWTYREDIVLKKLVEEGLPTEIIAERMGRSASAITSHRHCLGLADKGRSATAYTAEEVATIRRMAAADATARDIAKVLPGRSPKNVGDKARNMGIKLRPGSSANFRRVGMTQRVMEDSGR
jgi:hypothetical protein